MNESVIKKPSWVTIYWIFSALIFAAIFMTMMGYVMILSKDIIQYPIRKEVMEELNGLDHFWCTSPSRYWKNYFTCPKELDQVKATELEKTLFALSEKLWFVFWLGFTIIIFIAIRRYWKISLNWVITQMRKSSILKFIGLKILSYIWEPPINELNKK